MDRRHFIQGSAVASPLPACRRQRKPKAESDSKKLDRVTGMIKDWRRKDIDAVLAHVTDDIVWHSHVGSPPIIGKEAMRQTFDDARRRNERRALAHLRLRRERQQHVPRRRRRLRRPPKATASSSRTPAS